VDVTSSLYFASINVITHVEMMTCYKIIFVQRSVLFYPYEYVISKVSFVTFWRTKRYLVRRCDPKLDLGAKMGPTRPKSQSVQNLLKIDMCVGLIDTNSTQLERAQTNVVCKRYCGLFISSNMQFIIIIVQSVQC
jgi:hypothetical protein